MSVVFILFFLEVQISFPYIRIGERVRERERERERESQCGIYFCSCRFPDQSGFKSVA
jgi:hypothetical protein